MHANFAKLVKGRDLLSLTLLTVLSFKLNKGTNTTSPHWQYLLTVKFCFWGKDEVKIMNFCQKAEACS